MELNFILGIAASLATIASGSIAVTRHLGRAGVIEQAATGLGVDITELVIPNDPPERTAWLREMFTSEQLMVAATEASNPASVSNHVGAYAAAEDASVQLIGDALAYADRERTDLLGEHLTDSDIEAMAESRNVWPNPIERVIRIDDDPTCAYAWLLSDDATEEDRHSLKREMEEMYIQENAKEPESLHFIVNNIDEIRELDSETVETYVKPWLNNMDNTEDNR